MSLNPVLTQRKGKTGEHFNSSSIVLARLHLKCWEKLQSMELIFLTLILGATVLLAFYIAKIFKSEVLWSDMLNGKTWFSCFCFFANRNPQSAARSQVKEEIIEVADEAEVKSSPPPAPGPAPTKSKKKPEKKTKEKDTFKHPWLVTSLKVCLNVFSECKNKFRATVGGWWILISAPMGGIWPLVQRIRLLWFGAPSKHRAASNHIVLVYCREFSAREHKPLRCNVEFDHGLFVK